MSEQFGRIARHKVMAACEALGFDPMDVFSIAITGSEVSVCLFEYDEDGKRYFAEPTGLLGFAKRYESFNIVDNEGLEK